MTKELFKGQWIHGKKIDYGNEDSLYYHDHPNVILYKEFELESIDNTVIFRIAVLGYYILHINGKRVSDYELNNDWTDFSKCVYYDEYDVSHYLKIGKNTIEIELGNGMYNPSPLKLFGKYNLRQRLSEIGTPKAICEMYKDEKTILYSDSTWFYKEGQYLFNNLYLGEKIDFTIKSNKLIPVVASEGNYHFEKSFIPKIKKFKNITPKYVKEFKNGLLVDFGKMVSGYISIKIDSHINQEITLQYSEDFRDGNLFFDTSLAGSVGEKINDFFVPGGLGAPKRAIQTDYLKCNEATTYFENQFTYHSFRYVYITGCTINQLDNIEAIYVHTDLKQIGKIKCDNEQYNNLYNAALQTKLNNVHSVFEDCARERLGYGGDIVALGLSNLYTFDLERIYSKVIKDFRYEQTENGGIPETAPYMGIQSNGTADREGPLLWQLVYPYLVNKHYQFYGNRKVLEEELPYLKKHMDYILNLDLEYVVERCLGDHGSILIAGEFRKPTPDKLFLGYCALLLLLKNNIHILKYLNKDISYYQKHYDYIYRITENKFIHDDGTVGEGTQTGYAFALYLDMGDTKTLLDHFVSKIKSDNYIFNSGIFGMSLSYEVLMKYDRSDIIEKWLLNSQPGTFLEMLGNGDGVLSELFIGDHYSKNHAMFSSYQVFYYEGLAGIRIDDDAIGFNKIQLKPYFTNSMTHYSCSINTIHGTIHSQWNKLDKGYEWTIKVPKGISYQLNSGNYVFDKINESNGIIKVICSE